MSSTTEKSSTPPNPASAQNLVILGMMWGAMGLLFFLYSILLAQQDNLPFWYQIGTYVIELSAYLGSALLCFRNWRSTQMVSGRTVWLGIGLGMLSYFVAGLVFGWWELGWGLDPEVSPADLFYVSTYICLGWGMILAITSKRLELESWQWAILATVAIGGISLGTWVASPTMFGLLPSEPEALEQVAPASSVAGSVGDLTNLNSGKSGEVAPPITETEAESESENVSVPSWVMALDVKLQPFAYLINLFYIIGDVFLLILAAALLMAFWGGRFSQSWRMIAAGTVSLYIADMYFKWVDSQAEGSYQSGSLPEIFFVFSAIMFGIGAILEYDISTRSRQSRRGRRGATT